MIYTQEEQNISKALIEKQLSLTCPEEITFRNGAWKTQMTPIKREEFPSEKALSLSLCGEWKVIRTPFDQEEAVLASDSVRDDEWEKKQQPGKICIYDPKIPPEKIPNFDRIKMTHFTKEDGALIRRTVHIPAAWEGKEIFLCFEAVYPACRIYLNGEVLAEHRSGLTPIVIDVTEKNLAGKDVLVALRLFRYHEHIMLDMPRHSSGFAGISQPCRFFAKEKCRLSEYHLPSFLEENLKDASVKGTLTFINDDKKERNGEAEVALFAPDGSYVTKASVPVSLSAGEKKSVPVGLSLTSPLLWNDEHPYLYKVKITVMMEGLPQEVHSFRTGFRRFVLAQERAVLNGHPVKFRGVNHLTYHPRGGLFTPVAWLRRDLELMKKANINTIRTHYFSPAALPDLCDEMGFYLIQELPIDWGTHFIHDPAWVGDILMRLESAVKRDRNHTSVMIWAVGNENLPESAEAAPNGWMHMRTYNQFVKLLSPDKYTMFPPPGPAGEAMKGIFELRIGDVADTHYSFTLAKEYLRDGKVENAISWTTEKEITTKEEAMANGWSGVWFSSEYCLFSGNPDLIYSPNDCSIIDDFAKEYPEDTPNIKVFSDRFNREWDLMKKEPTCLGGTFFPWISPASDSGEGHPFSWNILAEDNDWGVMTPELIPKPTFWVVRRAYAPVDFPEEIEYIPGEEGFRLTLWNQYNDIDLAQCKFHISDINTSYSWMDLDLSLAPGEKKEFLIPFLHPWTKRKLEEGRTQVVRLTMEDPNGFVPTTRDIRITKGKGEYKGEAGNFDVGPQPEYNK